MLQAYLANKAIKRHTMMPTSRGLSVLLVCQCLLGLATAKAVAANSSDVELCFTGSGSFRIDIDVCSRALRTGTLATLTHAALYLRRGEAFLTGSVFELAQEDFNQTLALNPYSSSAYRLKGDSYFQSGNYDASTRNYDKALQLNQFSAKTFKGRGMASMMSGNFRAAISDFGRSLGLSHTQPETTALRAISYFAIGRNQDAERHFRLALSQAYPYPLGYLWSYAAAIRDKRSGKDHFEDALNETDPDIWPGQLIRGFFDPQLTKAAWTSAKKRQPEPKRSTGNANRFLPRFTCIT